eukprot:3606537-Prymnesium_polylepis.2
MDPSRTCCHRPASGIRRVPPPCAPPAQTSARPRAQLAQRKGTILGKLCRLLGHDRQPPAAAACRRQPPPASRTALLP